MCLADRSEPLGSQVASRFVPVIIPGLLPVKANANVRICAKSFFPVAFKPKPPAKPLPIFFQSEHSKLEMSLVKCCPLGTHEIPTAPCPWPTAPPHIGSVAVGLPLPLCCVFALRFTGGREQGVGNRSPASGVSAHSPTCQTPTLPPPHMGRGQRRRCSMQDGYWDEECPRHSPRSYCFAICDNDCAVEIAFRLQGVGSIVINWNDF